MAKSPEQRLAEVVGFLKVAVVRGMFARVIPNAFGGVTTLSVG